MKMMRERGQAFIAAVVALSLVLIILLAVLTFTQFSGKLVARQLTYQGQARNAAMAGLAEALSWFRRQTAQPVTTFNPLRNLPTVNDTDDPSIGIVRTFWVSQAYHIKGRYEVRYGTPGDLTKSPPVPPSDVFDITAQTPGKSNAPAGTVWQLESHGFIYVEHDSSKAYNQSPNQVLAKQDVRAVIQRMSVQPPANSAIFATGWSLMTINTGSQIQGGSSYIGAAAPSTSSGSIAGCTACVTGTPATSGVVPTVPNPQWSIGSVFGTSLQDLQTLADFSVGSVPELAPRYQLINNVPTLPNMAMIIINGNANFTAQYPLSGSGILIVLGNLNVAANSNGTYNGVIYCTGNSVVNQPTLISGTLINAGTGGTITVTSSGNVSQIAYSNAILQQINQQIGQYRYSRTPYAIP